MTTENNSAAGAVAPAATPTSAPSTVATTPAAAKPAEPPAAKTEGEPKDSAWFNKRIEQAKNSATTALLKELGVPDLDAAKKLAADAKAKADAEKTAEQRARELEESLKSTQSERDRLAATTKEYAARMMVGLTDAQREAVTKLAGEDPARQVEAIATLSPTWAKESTAAAGEDGKAKPTTTAPPAGAPSGVVPAGANARATYESIRTQNPFAAAAFGSANPTVYNPK